MQSHFGKMNLKTVFCITLALLLGAGTALAQQVNLTAGGTSLTLPDGSSVPMWGYSCDVAQPAGSTATCAKLNPSATGWSPVIITVPTGTDLKIQLTNNLTFAGNNVPTSLTIVGQLGGGLGDQLRQCRARSTFLNLPAGRPRIAARNSIRHRSYHAYSHSRRRSW